MESTSVSNPINEDGNFIFELYYGVKMVTCRVEAGESNYGVHFDNKLVAVIKQEEDYFTWTNTSRELEEVV